MSLFHSGDILYCRLVRFTSSGALDTSFGIDGFGDALEEAGVSIVLTHGAAIAA